MKEKGYLITKGKGILQYKQAMQETEHLRDKQSLLTKTIGILLNPTPANDSYIPAELLKQHQQKKKKLQQRRSQHL